MQACGRDLTSLSSRGAAVGAGEEGRGGRAVSAGSSSAPSPPQAGWALTAAVAGACARGQRCAASDAGDLVLSSLNLSFPSEARWNSELTGLGAPGGRVGPTILLDSCPGRGGDHSSEHPAPAWSLGPDPSWVRPHCQSGCLGLLAPLPTTALNAADPTSVWERNFRNTSPLPSPQPQKSRQAPAQVLPPSQEHL